jgi:hypothetical protein
MQKMAWRAKSRLAILAWATGQKLTADWCPHRDQIVQPTNQSGVLPSSSSESYHIGKLSSWEQIHPILEKSMAKWAASDPPPTYPSYHEKTFW